MALRHGPRIRHLPYVGACWFPSLVAGSLRARFPLQPVRRDNPGKMGGRMASPTFVGRLEELQTLEAAKRRAADGEPAVVLVGARPASARPAWSPNWPRGPGYSSCYWAYWGGSVSGRRSPWSWKISTGPTLPPVTCWSSWLATCGASSWWRWRATAATSRARTGWDPTWPSWTGVAAPSVLRCPGWTGPRP
jgi:hypothetical protein